MTERLTYDGNFCDIALCMEVRYGQSCPDGACSQRKVWERLKEYEGAMPLERVQELAEAEREGRLVVLPCKAGDALEVLCG